MSEERMSEERQRRMRKALGRIDSGINAVVRLLALPVLLCGLYIVADTIGVYADASPRRVADYKPERIDAEALRAISEDCVGWIQIDGTTIDYPIMRASNNTEYLNKDPYGEHALAGSIFMDYRNSADFTDEYTIIYGHHMVAGMMFGALDEYADRQFFDSHRHGTLFVGDDRYGLDVYAFLLCDASHDEVFDPREGLSEWRLDYMRRTAVHAAGDAGSRVLALTTCKSPGATDRTVLLLNIGEGTSETGGGIR